MKRPTQKRFDAAVEALRALAYAAIGSTGWQSHSDAVDAVETGLAEVRRIYDLTAALRPAAAPGPVGGGAVPEGVPLP